MNFDTLKSATETDHSDLLERLLEEHLDKLGNDGGCLWSLQEQLNYLLKTCSDPALALDLLSKTLNDRASLLAKLVCRLEKALAEDNK